ncbi:MAG: SDR family NAD(P)-dependent oxidoreductase [Thermoproteota archaeon]|nr:SDR family NAD(P)-dependent oxidoreductase [Thermoproteota archaeon]
MQEQERSSVAVVTGSSSGIGLETSLLLARSGFHTYATVRNIDKAQQLVDIVKKEKNELPLEILPLDITDDNSVKSTIDKIVNESGRIDVVVNNAGYGLIGALEDIPMQEMKAHFDTNLFGAIRVMQNVLPIMRKQRSGTIVNISSMGGRIAFPLSSTYSGTKFALEGVTDSLGYEVEQFGIKVILIEPGVVRTNFAKSMKKIGKTSNPNSPYAKLVEIREATRKERLESSSNTPDEVAKVVLKAITSPNPDARYVVGVDAASLLESKNTMTDTEFKKLMMRIFFVKPKSTG